jgi:hypothetical protein
VLDDLHVNITTTSCKPVAKEGGWFSALSAAMGGSGRAGQTVPATSQNAI